MTDVASCWIQVSSGRGPAECQLAVSKLVPIICKEARGRGLEVSVLDDVPGSNAGLLLSALISVSGTAAIEFCESWEGSVKWQCKSPLRPSAKRKNWFVAVDVLRPPETADTGVDPRDVRFEAFRASGAGGQHVNATDSAVRLTHIPSGSVVVAREERSQHMNRKLALARLTQILQQEADGVQAAADRERWSRHEQLERGNSIRVFKGERFQTVG